MDNLMLASILATAAMNRTARSALPDAPVVPDRPRDRRPRAVGPRRAVANGLEHLARAIAPASPHTS